MRFLSNRFCRHEGTHSLKHLIPTPSSFRSPPRRSRPLTAGFYHKRNGTSFRMDPVLQSESPAPSPMKNCSTPNRVQWTFPPFSSKWLHSRVLPLSTIAIPAPATPFFFPCSRLELCYFLRAVQIFEKDLFDQLAVRWQAPDVRTSRGLLRLFLIVPRFCPSLSDLPFAAFPLEEEET